MQTIVVNKLKSQPFFVKLCDVINELVPIIKY